MKILEQRQFNRNSGTTKQEHCTVKFIIHKNMANNKSISNLLMVLNYFGGVTMWFRCSGLLLTPLRHSMNSQHMDMFSRFYCTWLKFFWSFNLICVCVSRCVIIYLVCNRRVLRRWILPTMAAVLLSPSHNTWNGPCHPLVLNLFPPKVSQPLVILQAAVLWRFYWGENGFFYLLENKKAQKERFWRPRRFSAVFKLETKMDFRQIWTSAGWEGYSNE